LGGIVAGTIEVAAMSKLKEEPISKNGLIFDLVQITTEPLLVRDNIQSKT
jgi:hypothetical protein